MISSGRDGSASGAGIRALNIRGKDMRGDLSTGVSRASVTLGFSHQTPPSDPLNCSGDGGWRVRLATALADTLSGAGERLGEFTPTT